MSRSLHAAGRALVLLAAFTGCAPMGLTSSPDPVEPPPEAELQAGARALEADDFHGAALHLDPLSRGCLDDDVRVRAALLAVAAQLDPANPEGSADEAAELAARVLRSTPHGDPAFAHARALYRLALDRGGAAVAPSAVRSCTSGRIHVERLPEVGGPTTAARLRALGDTVAMRSDSLASYAEAMAARADSLEQARARAGEAEKRVRALEEELQRIRQLLRGGAEPSP